MPEESPEEADHSEEERGTPMEVDNEVEAEIEIAARSVWRVDNSTKIESRIEKENPPKKGPQSDVGKWQRLAYYICSR